MAVTVDIPIPEGKPGYLVLRYRWGAVAMDPYLPSPKKRIRFLALVLMGCSFEAAFRAAFAFLFQKSGTFSSSDPGDSESLVSMKEPPGVEGIVEALLTWDDPQGAWQAQSN